MDYKKLALYAILAMIGVTLWNDWLKEHPIASSAIQSAQTENQNFVPTNYKTDPTPEAAEETKLISKETNVSPEAASHLIHVKTDVLDVYISSLGGDIIKAALPQYPISLEQKNVPVEVLSDQTNNLYVMQSGLVSNSASDSKAISFSSAKSDYRLAANQDELDVVLQGQQKGIGFTKTYHFKKDSYAIGISYQLTNHASTVWRGSIYSQIKHKPVEQEHGFLQPRTYEGATISSPEKRYQKFPYNKLEKESISMNIQDGWMAMQQHYFLSAWIPNPKQTNHYYSHVASLGSGEYDKIYTVGFVSPDYKLAPGASVENTSTFYVGPETAKQLAPLAPGLDLTIDYGWLWIISKAIFWVMDQINNVVGNWGWSIVLVTIFIKLLFYKLSEASYRSMARMRELQPRLATLRERYGDDKQKLSQATMEIYKKEKINPLGGCLPVLVQIPVFIALYYVLFESVELRQAPFIFWIQDLSVKDPYYVLPVLMGLSMFLQQKLSPPPPDPTQAKVMMFLPLVFTVFFLSFPAGLVLYWLVNNCLSALQQWYIIKRMQAKHHH